MTENPEIVVYGTTWCPDCTSSRRFLDRQQIAYRWIDIDQDAAAREHVEQLNGGYRSVPTIVFPDGSILVEPTDKELARKLGL